ncbi:MAG: penicillin-binding transpeptidase domain-containing protein, partial [Chloroflexota bacterium]|nr:penicillin-binding transpeptidase domain-containing protein [Chloroflexota bacterium]
MARHKRIPYDPPGQRKKRGRGGPLPRAERIFLNRRLLIARGLIVAAFATLAARLGIMQVMDRTEYQAAARNNVVRARAMAAPRGLIFDRVGRPLAINQRAWEVRMRTGLLPEEGGTRRRVLDTLIDALRLPDALVLRPAGVPKGTEGTIYARIAALLDESEFVEEWSDQLSLQSTYNTLVLVKSRLTTDEAARFRAAGSELPGVSVMNILEYNIGNSRDPREAIVIKRGVPRDVAMKLEANRLYLPGVELNDTALVRSYPGGQVMSHLLGYVAAISENELKAPRNLTQSREPIYSHDDIIGKDGLERTMEELLRGHKGSRVVEVDSNEIELRTLDGQELAPVPGRNLSLTIDLEFQTAVSQALAEAITAARTAMELTNIERQGENKQARTLSQAGSVVAIDPRTGEVLAMVSLPHYDNQLFVDGISQRKFDEYRDPRLGNAFVNRSVMQTYPPGSTLKLFLAASALHRKTIEPATTYTCRGAIKVPYTWDEARGNNYPCWLKDGHRSVDLYGAIEQSCDIYFYNVGTPYQLPEGATEPLHYYDLNWSTGETSGGSHTFEGLGINRIHEDLRGKFWFGAATGIDLPLEAGGLVPDPEWLFDTYKGLGWSSGDTINVSIGQGYFESTPLQLALNTAALANGGIVHKPALVRGIVDDTQEP